MITVFTSLLPGESYIPLLYPNLGQQHRESILFLNNAFRGFEAPFVSLTNDPRRADYILLAYNYSSIRKRPDYIAKLVEIAERENKRLLVFAHGDADAPIDLPNAVVFRTSQYGYKKQKNEIMMPAYAEDLGYGRTIEPRQRSGDRPVIGFCGWADYKNLQNRIGTMVMNALVTSQALAARSSRPLARKKGLSFRRAAISALRGSPLVHCNFIIRSSYSGHQQTIRGDPAQTREEYIRNMVESDLCLVVKGDGNYSYRFYEALSLGRIPLLLNTDCILPLAEVIDYSAFVVSVDFRDVTQLPQIAHDFYHSIDDTSFAHMQKRAREMFEKYLSIGSFLKYAVERLL